MPSHQQEYFEINNVFTIETVVVSFVLEDVGIYIIILLRSEPVFLSLLENCGNLLSDCTQNRPSPLSSPSEVRFFSVFFFLLLLFSFTPGGSSYFIYSFVHVFIHLGTMNNAALNYVKENLQHPFPSNY